MKNFIIAIIAASACAGCASDKQFCRKMVDNLFIDLNHRGSKFELDDVEPKPAVNINLFYTSF